jgi:hypothetical protein
MFRRLATAIIVGIAGIAAKTRENKGNIKAMVGQCGSGKTPVFNRCAPEEIRTPNLLIRSFNLAGFIGLL